MRSGRRHANLTTRIVGRIRLRADAEPRATPLASARKKGRADVERELRRADAHYD
jgi:hypothetical protein